MGRLIALIVALVAGAAIARQGERTPDPAPASAPSTEFSAARAMADVAEIARAPHPIGSAENLRVRDYLLGRMRELGLETQVRAGVAVQQPRRAPEVVLGGPVENLLGVLPGRDRTAPALMLMAHYDSVPGSPGAADDAAGTAAALEIVRAIKARGVPARDVMVLITDGEEAGLLGANAFFRRDPLAERVGLVLNLETRGGGGRVQMFQTGPENGEAVRLLSRNGPAATSSSLAVFIYENMPNDTDLTESLAAGIQGLNYAFVGRQFDYHSASSTPANLDRGSLQHMGAAALGTASAAAFDPALPAPAPSQVFSNLFGDLIVAYPPWAGWVLIAVSAVLMAVAARRARRREAFPWTDVARGAGAALFAVLGAVALLQFARHATGAGVGFIEQRFLLAQVARWETAVMLLGLGFLLASAAELARGRRLVAAVPLLAGLGCQAFGELDVVGLGTGVTAAVLGVLAYGRPVSRPGAWAGVLLVGLVLAVVAQALAPPAAFVFAWPLLAASIAAAATDLGARRGLAGLAVLALVGALSIGWIGGFAHGSFLSMDLMPLVAFPVILAALAIWPLAQPADGAPPLRWLGASLVVAGLAVTAWVRFSDPWTPRHPEPSYVGYQLDQDTRRAWRYALPGFATDWTRAALQAGGGEINRQEHWSWRRPMDAAPAPYIETPAPQIELVRTVDGALRLSARPPSGATTLALQIQPNTPLRLVEVSGVATDTAMAPGKRLSVRWSRPEDGVTLVMRPAGPGRLEVRYALTYDRWPAGAAPLPPRPPTVEAFDTSDSTFVSGTRRLAW